MKMLTKYLKPSNGRIIWGLIIKFIGTIMDLLIPWILSHIIDKIIPTKQINLVLLWGGAMLLCALLALLSNIVANRLAAATARDTVRALRHDMFERIMYLPNTGMDRFTVPSLISRMTTDTYTIHGVIGMMLRMGVRAPILLLGGVVVTIFLDPVLALSMIAVMPIASFIMYYISKLGVGLYRKIQLSTDRMIRVVRENATGVRVIKALSKSEHEKERFEEVNTELTARERKAALIMSIIGPSLSFIMNSGFVVVIIIGAYRVAKGKAEIGVIIAFMTYFTIILMAIMGITRIFISISKASASVERIDQVLNAETEEELQLQNEQAIEKETIQEQSEQQSFLEFKNVQFTYPNSKFTMQNISFSVERTATLGIIGATGSGKSTLAQLLMRFYDIDKGQILIDGVDIQDMNLYELRSKFGVVFQNDMLFKNTIQENITLGRDLDILSLENAIKDARAQDFIQEAGGLQAEVAIKGMNFSGGQKQRMLIARALASKPQILILDDSSSALDYKTDALLREALKTNYGQSTKIIIAQRISSVMYSDQIMVLEEGRIIGLGTHEHLLESCDVYKEIADSQLGGPNE